ncbi:MAG: 4-hydroxy-tetrahydrodipicolinate reductase [Chloroflexi bacterium]|jgi:4-hydroxy-tetrahydrodipicolinate reductase|nr:MAG: 4-hydroxy-tetrahydrodipicolinate reductase [Chloroflexota bacterium]
MGQQVLAALCLDSEIAPVGCVDLRKDVTTVDLAGGLGSIPYASTVEGLLESVQADVLIDFSIASASFTAVKAAIERKVNVVIGTSGLGEEQLTELEALSKRHEVGVLVVPNFALGGIILGYLSKIAGRFFDYVDIYEAHHEAKIDAPSGTALALAKMIAEDKEFKRQEPEKESLEATRGGNYNGISIHSTRMPGYLAHHQVIFGALGQTLTLRHDSISRESFMPVVMLAAKEVTKRRIFEVGLEGVLGLS